jgi:hypothetical protein
MTPKQNTPLKKIARGTCLGVVLRACWWGKKEERRYGRSVTGAMRNIRPPLGIWHFYQQSIKVT